MGLAVSLILVFFFLFMNAFFVVAEFSCVRIRKSQIEIAHEAKRPGSAYAKMVAENVNAYLSACQLGITLASLALGWLGEPAISHLIHPALAPLQLSDQALSVLAVALGFSLITALHIVLGELIPKSLAILSTEHYALLTAAPLVWFYRITYPVMWLFNALTNAAMRLAGYGAADEHEVYTGEEIKLLIDESTESGLIDADQNAYVDNIFDMGDKDAEAIMTPRIDLVCFDVDAGLGEAKATAQQHNYTRFPVYKTNKDNIIGFLHIKDLYKTDSQNSLAEANLRSIQAVSENAPLATVLHVMQEHQTKIVLVVDEHGGTSGIVTMSDIMEQIVGRIDDEYLHEYTQDIKKITETSFLIEGTCAVEEVYKLLGFIPQGLHEPETLGGLIFDIAGEIPHEGSAYHLQGQLGGSLVESDEEVPVRTAEFLVTRMDNHRVAKVKLSLVTEGA